MKVKAKKMTTMILVSSLGQVLTNKKPATTRKEKELKDRDERNIID